VTAQRAFLQPDWSGIYTYRCRAYILNKEREAGVNLRYFKTHIRGLIGYLVRYQASNIYRIWVPEHRKVIITRNVQFNKRFFYSSHSSVSDGLTVAELDEVLPQIEHTEEEAARIEHYEHIATIDLTDRT
jgi:hypothetical protein